MSMLRVVVTGGSGRVGAHVVRELVERGHQVVNVDRRPGDEPRAKFVYSDVRRRELLHPILAECDAVCHLAEIPNRNGAGSPDEVFSANITATSAVIQTAADLKLKHLVYTSSCQVYGAWGNPRVPPLRLPVDELHPVQPQNAYALSKVANESFAEMTSRQTGLPISIFRLPWVMSYPLKDWWFDQLDRGELDGDGYYTYVHAADVARAYALAVESMRGGCEVYHASAVEVMCRYPLREEVKIHYPNDPQLPADWPKYQSPLIAEKLKNHLGWEPKWNFLDLYRQKRGRDPIPA